MPNFYRSVYQGLRLGLLSACLTACSSTTKDTPAPVYTVQMRLTCTDGTALGPGADISVKHDQQPDQHMIGTVISDNGITTIPVGNFKSTDEMILEVSFIKVDRTTTLQLRPTSKILGEVLVNGQVKATVILDNTLTYWTNTYASNTVRVKVAN